MADLAALGLAPNPSASADADLIRKIELVRQLRIDAQIGLSSPSATYSQGAAADYLGMSRLVADMPASTPEGVMAKLELALTVLGVDQRGWKNTIWHLPIRAIQDVIRVGV